MFDGTGAEYSGSELPPSISTDEIQVSPLVRSRPPMRMGSYFTRLYKSRLETSSYGSVGYGWMLAEASFKFLDSALIDMEKVDW